MGNIASTFKKKWKYAYQIFLLFIHHPSILYAIGKMRTPLLYVCSKIGWDKIR